LAGSGRSVRQPASQWLIVRHANSKRVWIMGLTGSVATLITDGPNDRHVAG
jgi:hypothetical protein